MPQQMRGFWVCDFCNAAFDTSEEAQFHEASDCHHRPSSSQRLDDERGVEHLAQGDYETTRRSPAEPFPPSDTATQQQPIALPLEDPAAHYDAYQHHHSQQHQHEYLLLDPRDSYHEQQSQGLAPADAVSCRNLQLFQDEHDHTHTQQQPQIHNSQSQQQQYRIGLVCRRCSSLGARLSDSELSMPRSIDSIADAVYSMADRHLQTCELLPSEERLVIQQGVHLRQVAHQQPHSSEQLDNQRRALADFLKFRSMQLGIINRYPENSGICFETTAATDHAAPAAMTQQPPSPTHYTQQQAHSPTTLEAEPTVPPRRSPHETTTAVATVPHHTGPPERYANEPSVAAIDHHSPKPRHSQSPPRPFAPPPPPNYLPPEALAMRHAAVGAAMDPHHPHAAAAAAAALYHHGPQSPNRHLHLPPPPSYELPANFPFFQDPYEGDWLCKYCSHVHPQYRDLNYRWATPERTPPPGDFIDHHLSLCRAYLEQQQQHLSEYYRSHTAERFPPEPHSPYAYPHGPHDAGYASVTGAAVSYPPLHHAHAPMNPEVSPMTPATSYVASSYDAPGMPLGHYDHPHDARVASQPRSAPQSSSSPGKMGPVARKAIQFLTENDRFAEIPDDQNLVRQEDKLLLTDFLYFLMKQLQVVRFSEGDRKTRGGKRENINLGFGGLQCIHCASSQKSRKFFWSGVDRLANSFAEIPSHVFKCKDCPDTVKEALSALKEVHPDQMSRLPRGSQKVFFRRVWKRIHDDDPPPTPTGDDSSPRPPSGLDDLGNPVSPAEDTKQASPAGTDRTSGSDDSPFLIERPTQDAAKALADMAHHASNVPLSPSSRILLSIAEDRDFLSEQDCFIRRQIEVFCATSEDVRVAISDSRFPVEEGQVGLRCIHCSMAKHGPGARGTAVVYPYSISGIFEAVREFQRVHLASCENMPPAWKAKLDNTNESSTISSIQRKYYYLAAKGLGLKDSRGGIRAGSESVPVVSQAVFSFSDLDLSDGWRDHPAVGQLQPSGDVASSVKRQLEEHDESQELSMKRPHFESG